MKVFYRPEQVAATSSFSLSPLKPKLVVQDWVADPLIHAEICTFEPAEEAVIAMAHDARFVRGILAGEIRNGFGNCDVSVAASLPYTSGSMIAAAEYAVLHKQVVCSPTSGFHHAEYASAQGYCTFNGLMVTALSLKRAGLVHRVGIIDCDAHYGNGTDHILRVRQIDWVSHHTQGRTFHSHKDVGHGEFPRWLHHAIDACLDCDLVLYQAGADPHVDDPLGGILSSQEMSARDRLVFERLGHVPMVWNLAGGYQTVDGETDAQRLEPVLALHRETARLHTAILG
jgi:acetoin utilization deacetylase AcuC-like enzyme